MTTTRAVREAQSRGASSGTLAPFLFTLRTKGAGGLANRVATVATRFGPTPYVMMRRLERMIAAATDVGFRPTCPITATVLARHPEHVRALSGLGMEIAVHGLRHNDHLAQDAEVQEREIAQAVAVFMRHGIEPAGFRAPYLRADHRTAAAVRRAGLGYQSDDAVVFDADGLPAVDTDEGYHRAVAMYDAQPAATTTTRPSLVDGLVRIPVCLPDDEMLVDRLRVTDDDCGRAWLQILETTHQRGDLFTMQVHPERFVRSGGAVRAVLERASALHTVWTARLDEIAAWWRARDACRIERVRMLDGSATYQLVGDRRARMRLVGGTDVAAADREPTRSITLPADRLPAVRLAGGATPAERRLLHEEGFLVAEGPAGHCALELSGALDPADALMVRRRIAASQHPVLAVDRWPVGATSALALTGDIDALTVQDFVHRMRENASGAPAWITNGAP